MNNVPPLILVGYTTLTNSISNTLTSMAVTNRQIEDWASPKPGAVNTVPSPSKPPKPPIR